jgi:hypothetical protein
MGMVCFTLRPLYPHGKSLASIEHEVGRVPRIGPAAVVERKIFYP